MEKVSPNWPAEPPKARTALSQRCLAAGHYRSLSVVTGPDTGRYGAKGGRPVWISALSAKAAGPKKGEDEVSVSGPQTLERSFQNK